MLDYILYSKQIAIIISYKDIGTHPNAYTSAWNMSLRPPSLHSGIEGGLMVTGSEGVVMWRVRMYSGGRYESSGG